MKNNTLHLVGGRLPETRLERARKIVSKARVLWFDLPSGSSFIEQNGEVSGKKVHADDFYFSSDDIVSTAQDANVEAVGLIDIQFLTDNKKEFFRLPTGSVELKEARLRGPQELLQLRDRLHLPIVATSMVTRKPDDPNYVYEPKICGEFRLLESRVDYLTVLRE
jgi:hypothetical protein